ncbi:transcription factor bHLH68 isoform X5 [Rosa chinensis]|uniref:transcription factor bHLH68 isoform X5 n=1 Tax=Rosa chinensis TaxID=74649 RepID=UPI000D09058A|nr:transcription factor bHLH68 isoform X5 [Rosa chinensis]
MNRGHVLQSSPVQQMMAAGNPNWWNINSMRAPTTNQPSSSPFLPAPHHPSFFIPQFQPTSSSSSSLPFIPSWHDNNNQNQNQELPESWSQLLLRGGLVGEDDKANGLRQLFHQGKKLEDWEEQILSSQAHLNAPVNVDVKQENSPPGSFLYGHHGNGNNNEDFQSQALCSLSQIMPTTTAASASSPKSSCVTSFGSNMLDFSNKSEGRHPPPSRSSSECNSSATGGAVKKARVQPSSSAQPTFKVRKEKLGDRITALHQLVSPFGKALSLPYLGSGSPNMRQQQQQSALLNDNCMKRKGVNSEQDAYEEPKKDLRSRGLCLVPVSCTLQVGSDNGADYWAPAALGGGFQ